MRQQFHQISEIVRAVKSHLANGVVADQTGRHHQFCEPERVNPKVTILLKINALATQQLDRVVGVSVTRDVEISEVEFPDEGVGGAEGGKVSGVVGKGKADLNQVEAVDVGFEYGVVRDGLAVAEGGVAGVGTHDDTGELGVHRDERERIDDGSD